MSWSSRCERSSPRVRRRSSMRCPWANPLRPLQWWKQTRLSSPTIFPACPNRPHLSSSNRVPMENAYWVRQSALPSSALSVGSTSFSRYRQLRVSWTFSSPPKAARKSRRTSRRKARLNWFPPSRGPLNAARGKAWPGSAWISWPRTVASSLPALRVTSA